MQEEINKIIVKETLVESDIKFLMKNINILPDIALIRLGLKSVSTPVVEVVTEPISEPTEAIEEVKPKTRGRKKVIK